MGPLERRLCDPGMMLTGKYSTGSYNGKGYRDFKRASPHMSHGGGKMMVRDG